MSKSWKTAMCFAAAAAAVAGYVAATGCSPGQPKVRLQVVPGRTVVYEISQRVEWPGEDKPPVEVDARVRFTCAEFGHENRGRWTVSLERLRIKIPDASGVSFDTATEATEPGDDIGAEALVRPLLGHELSLVLDTRGHPEDVQATPELYDPVKAWTQVDFERRGMVGRLIATTVDPRVLIATSFGPLSLALPDDASAPDGASWVRDSNQIPDLPGAKDSDLSLKLSRPSPDRAVVDGELSMSPQKTGVVGEGPALSSGSFTIHAALDTQAGTVEELDVAIEMKIRDPSGGDRVVTVRQSKTVRRVE